MALAAGPTIQEASACSLPRKGIGSFPGHACATTEQAASSRSAQALRCSEMSMSPKPSLTLI